MGSAMPKIPKQKKKSRVLVLLGKRLAEARRAKGYSQESFANEMGLHRTYAGMIERGERNMTVINLLRACTALSIKPGDLLDGLPLVPAKDAE